MTGQTSPRHFSMLRGFHLADLFTGVLMLAFYRDTLYGGELLGITWHAVVLLFLVSGSLMISKTLRIPKP